MQEFSNWSYVQMPDASLGRLSKPERRWRNELLQHLTTNARARAIPVSSKRLASLGFLHLLHLQNVERSNVERSTAPPAPPPYRGGQVEWRSSQSRRTRATTYGQ